MVVGGGSVECEAACQCCLSVAINARGLLGPVDNPSSALEDESRRPFTE